GANASRESWPPIVAVSSSWTIFTTCWPGVRLLVTSSPTARSFTRATKSLITCRLTSASSSARRISRIAFETDSSSSRPRPRRSPRVCWSLSESVSNTAGEGYRDGLSACPYPGRRPLLGDEGPGEVARVERAEVVQALTPRDDRDRQIELARDRDRDPALRRSVQLRERTPGHSHRLAEQTRLLEAVLTRRRVDDEQGLVRCALELRGDHAAHLRELLH